MKPRRTLHGFLTILASALFFAQLHLFAGAAVAQSVPEVAMVSRERLLQRVAVARQLLAEEQRMTAVLQAQIDRTKEALADEEAELAKLRGELPVTDFATRIEDFDGRMRRARQITQERSGELQRGFQEARASVVAQIPGVIEALRREVGARVILNADAVLAADPAMDLTDRAVTLFDRIAAPPKLPEVDLNLPLLELLSADEEEADAQDN